MLPNFLDLDLANQPIWHGYYTLGLIKKYRPDIELIPFRLQRPDRWTERDRSAQHLEIEIDRALHKGHKVLLVPWEEDYMGCREDSYTELFNSYQHDEFYFVSEMDQQGQLIFRDYHGLTCKILELPFLLVNDCISYSSIRSSIHIDCAPKSQHNFLCMIGRSEKHKWDLVHELHQQQLDGLGLITGSNPPSGLTAVQTEPSAPRYRIEQLLTEHRKESAQIMIQGIWASSNVENFLYIETTYDMPLIINPESTMGIFPATEKSIWPALLGRMYLIQAQPGAMAYVQRFHSVDQSRWANLEFDALYGWDDHDHCERRTRMLQDNRELIQNSRDIYRHLADDLDRARALFTERIYKFFCDQVAVI